VAVYPDEYAGAEDDQGVKVLRLSARGLPLVRLWSHRRRVAKALALVHQENPIDILEGGEIDLSIVGRTAPGVKVLRMHGGARYFGKNRTLQMKERWAFRVADEICGVSQYVVDQTNRLLGLGNRPMEVIPNPVDVDLFSPAPDGREEDGLIVFTGTVTERKGIRELLLAMPRIVAAVPRARLEVYGGDDIFQGNEGAFRKSLEQSLPPELATRVSWKGRVSRNVLPTVLQRASVCVYPSHLEAMPIAWLEGLSSGKAVVASGTGPGPEVIEDGVTGLLCDPRSPDSIAEKVIQLLASPEMRRRLGSAARKTAVERYSLGSLIERNLGYYGRVRARHRAGKEGVAH
jgi:glycosyltransferase involved in cell wall biosynthesis